MSGMKRRDGVAAALTLALLAGCGAADAQGGDPAPADMAGLEEALDRYEAVAALALEDASACLEADRAQWLDRVEAECGADAACRRDAALTRLATLNGLQPGATALTADLPVVPVLSIVIPPEMAGDGVWDGTLEVDGALVRELEDIHNMGLAVRDAAGRSHAIVFDMDIGNSPAHYRLHAMIDAAGGTYRVIGAARDGGFAIDSCRFLYRLPG